jgi:hypothetical protein
VSSYPQMLKQQIDVVQQGGDPMNIINHAVENVPWTPTLEGWPKATIEAATRAGSARRQGPSGYQFNFHKVSQGGW